VGSARHDPGKVPLVAVTTVPPGSVPTVRLPASHTAAVRWPGRRTCRRRRMPDRQRQTRREAGTQSHGPLAGSRATETGGEPQWFALPGGGASGRRPPWPLPACTPRCSRRPPTSRA